MAHHRSDHSAVITLHPDNHFQVVRLRTLFLNIIINRGIISSLYYNEMIKKQDIAPLENGLPRYNLSDERTSSLIPVITKRTGDQENYETEKN